MEQFVRTKRLLGDKSMELLKNSHVAVFGIGGVGGHATDALVRSGIGEITIVDSDEVAISNINRQLIATYHTVGRKKVDVMKEHLLEINPNVKVHTHCCFFLPETEQKFDFTQYDYVIDAVDTVTAKIALVMMCEKANVPIISSMGAGNKLDPTAFEVADIYKTSVCPLAKVMRRELKKRNVKHLKVVYSKEEAITPIEDEDFVSDETRTRRATPGSIAFVPSVAGLILAGEVIKDLAKNR
ncbi:MAG: tRNA threonylcarbamoyladenosine dehydratase [Lachnospiraceae bacterium]|nr:tRNA threonylcarbamoyladenosine dehydratase [Lachnospiraceae bacterium]